VSGCARGRRPWLALAVRIVAVAGLYGLAAIICTYPLVLHLADGLLGAPDALLESWVLGWDVHALSTDPWHLYDANIYYPFPLPLTYADPMLTGALMVAPILLATGNAALADNVLTLASLVLAGLGTYLLVRRLSGSDAGGLVAGGIFAFCAVRQAHLEHVQLLQLGWLPLGLLALHVALERRQVAAFGLFALCTIAQALTSFYLAWMMAVAYGVFLVVEALARRTLRDRATLSRLAGALLLAGLVVVAVAWPYARTQQLYHFQWQLDVLRDLSAGPSDYLSVPVQSLVYGPLLGRFARSQFTNEHILFPGLVTSVLVGLVFGRWRRLNLEMVRYGLIGLVALVLSFGPLLRLDENHALPLPYDVLLRWVPAFGVMRVPARWDFLLMLALAVLAGFGLAWLSATVGRRAGRSAQRVLYATLGLVMLLEVLPWPLPIALVATPAALPPVYAWLRTQDPSAVVAEVPARGPNGFASFGYEYLSTYHWHPLVNGRSGFDPPAAAQVLDTLDAFPDPVAITHLRSLGVRYLIVHRAALGPAERQRLADADANLEHLGLSIAASFDDDDVVYALAPPSSPAGSLQDHLHLELPSLVSRDVTPSVTATLTNPTAEPMVVGAPQAIGADISWGQVIGATSQAPLRDMPLFIDPHQEVWLHFPASLGRTPGGQTTQLTIRLNGAIQLEASRDVRVVDGHTSVDRSGLAGHLEQVRLPPHLRAGSQVTIDVVVRNTGQAVWLPEPIGQAGTHGAVGVGIKGWFGADGQPLPPAPDANAHGHVQWAVSPGQSALVSLPATVPPAPGIYSLVLDMVSETVTWFDEVDGGARTTVPVTIEP